MVANLTITNALKRMLIEDLATSALPKDFYLNDSPGNSRYLVFPEKFLSETSEVLSSTGLAIPDNSSDYEDWVVSTVRACRRRRTAFGIMADTVPAG